MHNTRSRKNTLLLFCSITLSVPCRFFVRASFLLNPKSKTPGKFFGMHHICNPPFSPTLHIQNTLKTIYTTFYVLYCGVVFSVIPHLYALLYYLTSSIFILHILQQLIAQSYNISRPFLSLINYGTPTSM